jgi:hypothetical protein
MAESALQLRELDRSEWPLFFDRLSRQYQGHRVTVEAAGDFRRIRTMARHIPLMGITVEPDGNDEAVIEIMTGDSPDAYISHTVVGPSHVMVRQPVNGEDREIEIISADGSRLTVELETAISAAARESSRRRTRTRRDPSMTTTT